LFIWRSPTIRGAASHWLEEVVRPLHLTYAYQVSVACSAAPQVTREDLAADQEVA